MIKVLFDFRFCSFIDAVLNAPVESLFCNGKPRNIKFGVSPLEVNAVVLKNSFKIFETECQLCPRNWQVMLSFFAGFFFVIILFRVLTITPSRCHIVLFISQQYLINTNSVGNLEIQKISV